MHPVETIIREACDKAFFEGKVTHCDPLRKWCETQCADGDSKETTHNEVKHHFKPSQKHSPKSQKVLLDFKRGDKAMLTKRQWHNRLHRDRRCHHSRQKINDDRLRALQAKVEKGKASATVGMQSRLCLGQQDEEMDGSRGIATTPKSSSA